MRTLLISIGALLLTKFFLVAAHPIPETSTPIQVLESSTHDGSFFGEINVHESAGLRTLIPENNNLEARTEPPVWQDPPIEIPQVFVPPSAGNLKLYLNVPYPGHKMGVSSILSLLRSMETAMGDEKISPVVSHFRTTLMQYYKLPTLPRLEQETRDPLPWAKFEALQYKIKGAVASHNEGNWLEDGILTEAEVETELIKNIVASQVYRQSHSRAPSRHGYRADITIPPGPPPSSHQFNSYYTPPSQYGPAQIGPESHSRAPSRRGYRADVAIPTGPPPSSHQFKSYYTPPSQYGSAQIGQSYAPTGHSAVPTYQYNSHLAPSPYAMPGISELPSHALIPNNHGTLGPAFPYSHGVADTYGYVDPNLSGAHLTYPQYSNPAIQGNNQYRPAIPPIPLQEPHFNNVAPEMSIIAGPGSAPSPSTSLWKRAGSILIPDYFLSGGLHMSVPTVDNKEGYHSMVELLGLIASTARPAHLYHIMNLLRTSYEFPMLYMSSLKLVKVDPNDMFVFRDEVKEKLDIYNKRFVPDPRKDDLQREPQPYNVEDAARVAMQRRKGQ